MKKPSSISKVPICIILLLLLLAMGCSDSSESKCINSSRDIPSDSINIYISNYIKMVKSNDSTVVQQVYLTDKELSCLSKLPSDELKFFFAAYDPKNDSTTFIIVEVDKKDSYSYYDLDDMYPGICPKHDRLFKSSSHLCPPPNPCAVPLMNKKS